MYAELASGGSIEIHRGPKKSDEGDLAAFEHYDSNYVASATPPTIGALAPSPQSERGREVTGIEAFVIEGRRPAPAERAAGPRPS